MEYFILLFIVLDRALLLYPSSRKNDASLLITYDALIDVVIQNSLREADYH